MLTAKLGIVPLKFCFKLLFTAQQLVSKEYSYSFTRKQISTICPVLIPYCIQTCGQWVPLLRSFFHCDLFSLAQGIYDLSCRTI
jgi:hypothetical protein